MEKLDGDQNIIAREAWHGDYRFVIFVDSEEAVTKS
jgi:hypothetical protein